MIQFDTKVISHLKITLPNGATVKYMLKKNWIYDTTLTPSIFDEDNVDGLCGNPNHDTSDEFGSQKPSINEAANFQNRSRYIISLV